MFKQVGSRNDKTSGAMSQQERQKTEWEMKQAWANR
jgi:hypothetical protein